MNEHHQVEALIDRAIADGIMPTWGKPIELKKNMTLEEATAYFGHIRANTQRRVDPSTERRTEMEASVSMLLESAQAAVMASVAPITAVAVEPQEVEPQDPGRAELAAKWQTRAAQDKGVASLLAILEVDSLSKAIGVVAAQKHELAILRETTADRERKALLAKLYDERRVTTVQLRSELFQKMSLADLKSFGATAPSYAPPKVSDARADDDERHLAVDPELQHELERLGMTRETYLQTKRDMRKAGVE
jgi:hypothetical protein